MQNDMDAPVEHSRNRAGKDAGPAGRGPDGRFLPGASGNRRGRPLGSSNRASLMVEQLLEDRAQALAEKVIEMALAGDGLALRLCLERLLPARKERHLLLQLPEPVTVEDITAGFRRVVEALTDGRLTPSETNSVAALLESARRTLETTELDRRLRELEARLVSEC